VNQKLYFISGLCNLSKFSCSLWVRYVGAKSIKFLYFPWFFLVLQIVATAEIESKLINLIDL